MVVCLLVCASQHVMNLYHSSMYSILCSLACKQCVASLWHELWHELCFSLDPSASAHDRKLRVVAGKEYLNCCNRKAWPGYLLQHHHHDDSPKQRHAQHLQQPYVSTRAHPVISLDDAHAEGRCEVLGMQPFVSLRCVLETRMWINRRCGCGGAVLMEGQILGPLSDGNMPFLVSIASGAAGAMIALTRHAPHSLLLISNTAATVSKFASHKVFASSQPTLALQYAP